MLCLSRKNGQTVIIRGDIKITVYSATPVRLAIEAPKEVTVNRGEVEERKREAA